MQKFVEISRENIRELHGIFATKQAFNWGIIELDWMLGNQQGVERKISRKYSKKVSQWWLLSRAWMIPTEVFTDWKFSVINSYWDFIFSAETLEVQVQILSRKIEEAVKIGDYKEVGILSSQLASLIQK